MRVVSPILLFFARHDVKWRPCISTLRLMDIMNQVCLEGTYFGGQHILNPANNSSWAWHTVAAMLAIWDDPKSWAHLATLPFSKLEGFGRRPKDMLDAYDLIPILWHNLVQVGQLPQFAPTMSVRIFGHFEQFFHISCPPCTMFNPLVHAGRMDQWTIYDMGDMDIGPHCSHTTWAKRSNLR